MNTFFDKETANKMSKKIKDLLYIFEVNHFIFTSSEYVNKKIKYSEIENSFRKKSDFKIVVDQVFPINGFIKVKGKKTANWKSYERLKEVWLKAKYTLIPELDELAGKGENKYVLNSFFLSLFEMLDKKISVCNLESWITTMNAANNRERMLLEIGSDVKPHLMVEFNLDIVLPFMRNELTFRETILSDIKYELVKIYSKHLLLPGLNYLPKIPFVGKSKTDIYEVLVMLENYAYIKDFELLKSFLLEILDLDKSKYKDYKSEILKRKVKYKFLKKVLKDAKDISMSD